MRTTRGCWAGEGVPSFEALGTAAGSPREVMGVMTIMIIMRTSRMSIRGVTLMMACGEPMVKVGLTPAGRFKFQRAGSVESEQCCF